MRLVDLHCDWLRQYATETTLFDGSLYPEAPRRVGRLDGYLLGTSLAVLACARKPDDWSGRADVWDSLGLMIARYEAEFAGRLLRDAANAARWRSSPAGGMCWGVLGVSGFDHLVRQAEDLDRLLDLFERGVRVFQPVAAGGGVLAGSAAPGDDRGLTDLGRDFLARLAEMARGAGSGPRPILDLAGMNAATMADALRLYDGMGVSADSLAIVVSRWAGGHEAPILGTIRARGGTMGLTPGRPGCETHDDLKRRIDAIATLPFEGRPGYEGIGIASDLLGVDRAVPGLSSAREIAHWLGRTFDREAAAALAAGNVRRLLLKSVGFTSEDVQTRSDAVASP